MNKDTQGVIIGILLMVGIFVTFGLFLHLIDKVIIEPQIRESMSEAKDLADKQITANMTYEQKVNIVKISCEFVFGGGAYIKCNKDLLDYYTSIDYTIHISK